MAVLLAAVWGSPAWASTPPQPGTINYIEGQVSIDGQPLTAKSVGSTQLAPGQSLTTEAGRAEILLTPGVFFRAGEHTSIRMISPGLANTILAIDQGKAMVEVAEIRDENNIRVRENGASVRLLKTGLYDFDADRQQVLVFDGKAAVQTDDREVKVKGGRQLVLNVADAKPHKFDKKAYEDTDFYRWASLRSAYLAEANVNAARSYAGSGWYWSPWYGAYTFIPANGIFFDPFGWSYYSPWAVGVPYYGYGYGFQHFGPSFHPHYRRPIHRFGGFTRGGNSFSHAVPAAPRGSFASPRAGRIRRR